MPLKPVDIVEEISQLLMGSEDESAFSAQFQDRSLSCLTVTETAQSDASHPEYDYIFITLPSALRLAQMVRELCMS